MEEQVIISNDGDVDVLIENISLSDIIIEEDVEEVIVTEIGLPGPQGPQGEPGISGDAFYLHDQMIAASTWNITHNLNKYPAVSIVTSAGDEVVGDVNYVNNNSVQLTFSAAFAGKAYLN